MKAKLVRFAKASVAVTVLVSLGWTAYALVHYLRTSARFEVKQLAVSGQHRVKEGQVFTQAGRNLSGTNIFSVDLDALRQRVEQLNWVHHAMVQRVLPDRIIIKITERIPIGRARIQGETYQFDVDAEILPIDSHGAPSFPVLDGLEPNDSAGNLIKVAIYQEVVEALGEKQLSEVHIAETGEVSVVSANEPLLVSLGEEEYRTRWMKYLQLKTQIQQQYPDAVQVDLRFHNQVIIRMKSDDDVGKVIQEWDGERKSL